MPRLRSICAPQLFVGVAPFVTKISIKILQLQHAKHFAPRRSTKRKCQQNMALHYFLPCTSSGASQPPGVARRQPPAVIVRSIVPKIVVARWRPSCQQRRINLAAHKANYSQALIHYSCCYCIFYFQFAVYCKFGQPLWSAPGAFFCRCTITRRLLCNGFWSEAAQKTFETFL